MKGNTLTYSCGGASLNGFLCHLPDIKGKRPGVLVAHAWRGVDYYTRTRTSQLAELGYIALAADVYGNPQPIETDEEAAANMMPLFLNRALLRERIRAGLTQLANHPLVDPNRIAAIGFCFGGFTVLELQLSGAKVKGVVSLHGVLGTQLADQTAQELPTAPDASGRALILHGNDDPLVPWQDVQALQKKLSDAHIDWQVVVYGGTQHAFTNPDAANAALGLHYRESISRSAWNATTYFLNDLFLEF